jgi:DNA-binding NarL/FixJ family response regulator
METYPMGNSLQNQQPTVNTITVMIVEDDKRTREMYFGTINTTDDIECIGAYESAEDALKGLEKDIPSVLLMDIGLPGMSGIEAVQKIKEEYPTIEILMLTVYDDDEKIFKSICAGASGYILKNAKKQELIESIRGILHGAPMSPLIARRLLNLIREKTSPQEELLTLSPRERKILELLVEGYSEKRIAESLYISPLTVHTHIKNIYEKLHVHSRAAAISKAIKNRLL